MTLKIIELINILLSAFAGGMYWGPWLALTISLKKFEPAVFLPVVSCLNKNMAPLMTVLSPVSLLLNLLVLFFSFNHHRTTFYCTFVAFVLFSMAVFTTVAIEVPIVKRIITWTEMTLPANWKEQRERWGRYHMVRVACGLLGLTFLLAGILF